jgi:hypothetical protein
MDTLRAGGCGSALNLARHAEGLDRNPVSLAILTLIELALKPGLMVRPPKSLTVTFAN